jgi:hypothetical protein
MSAAKDVRHFQRVKFDNLITFEYEDYSHQCELIDISFRGALITNCTGATPGVGTACRLILSLDQQQQALIMMQGSIAHKHDNRVGIRCEQIDLDSMTHLRKLVEMNVADSELLERELHLLCS